MTGPTPIAEVAERHGSWSIHVEAWSLTVSGPSFPQIGDDVVDLVRVWSVPIPNGRWWYARLLGTSAVGRGPTEDAALHHLRVRSRKWARRFAEGRLDADGGQSLACWLAARLLDHDSSPLAELERPPG